MIYSYGHSGVWHSLVVRLVRDQEAAGSSPVTPIAKGRYVVPTLFAIGIARFAGGLLCVPNQRFGAKGEQSSSAPSRENPVREHGRRPCDGGGPRSFFVPTQANALR